VAERITLHIGTMKSGTTYLQNILAANDEHLRAGGWLYPATWRAKGEVPTQQFAFYGLLGPAIPWVSADRHVSHREAWDRLAVAMDAWDGPVLLSAEALVALDESGIRALLDALPAVPIDVVLTARSLGSVLPSSWQQHLRNGHSQSFDGYLSMIRDGRADGAASPSGRIFWRSYDLADALRRWSGAVGPDRCTVVTVGSGAPDVLWHRFIEAAGLPDTVPAEPPSVPRDLANVGASGAEALILEAMLASLVERGVPQPQRRAHVRRLMVNALLPRPDRGTQLRIPAAWGPEVVGWANADIAAIEASGVRVIGSLEELRADGMTGGDSLAPPEQVAAAAAEALLVLARPQPRRPAVASGGRLRRMARRLMRRLRGRSLAPS
jgi:hypothetical protein